MYLHNMYKLFSAITAYWELIVVNFKLNFDKFSFTFSVCTVQLYLLISDNLPQVSDSHWILSNRERDAFIMLIAAFFSKKCPKLLNSSIETVFWKMFLVDKPLISLKVKAKLDWYDCLPLYSCLKWP